MLEELLRQHQLIRDMMKHCYQLMDRVDQEPGLVNDLITAVSRLRWAVTSHNRVEEQLLGPVLREADSFGPQRVEQMVHSHRDEHEQIGERLDTPTLASLRQTLAMLTSHLEHEEKTFLSSRVLRDDLVTIEGAG
jgi:iron-sulfur cluster repair protein YtfE (RIC family)